MMQPQKVQYATPIHGLNFQGMLHTHPDYLKITVIQSQHQRVHNCKINSAYMMQNPAIFTIFRTLDEIRNELEHNNNMEITDQKKLVINIDVNYKDKVFHHCITLQTEQVIFQSVIKLSEFLFDHLSEVNRYYERQRKINLEKGLFIINSEKQRELAKKIEVQAQTALPPIAKEEKKPRKLVSNFQLFVVILFFYLIFHQIYFREVKETEKIRINFTPILNKKFNFQNNGVITNNISSWNAILHSQSLPSKGIYYYEFMILQTKNKYIMSGICGKHISEQLNSALYYSKFFISIYTLNGYLYADGKAIDGKGAGLDIQNTVIGVEINLNQNHIIWSLNKKPIFLAVISDHFFNTKMNPCISMTTINDKIKLIN